ncbi:MSHA biogenesis protein MshP [Shewanella sp. C32]|uniref:MSHA biogenesis protein MshP n=1 Tax=Shewanella electrica TaxID=515560 RepID=A0ABT2FI51_9GAMM|nr:MSHA biogenesis protein MshP [Shewanella electrica]MCS4556017.1 MSHA biogenesis protein MshP [Shewanella electrica]
MCHSYPMRLGRQQQRGASLMIALFIIVVMAVLATSLIRISSDADEGVNIEVWSVRAFYAANSGADAALAQLFPLNGNAPSCANVDSQWIPPDSVGFSGCAAVQLSCNTLTAGELSLYRITSSAVCETGVCDESHDENSQCLRVHRSVEVEARASE